MRGSLITGFATLMLVTACAAPSSTVRVKCGATDVLMPGALSNQIKEQTGELEFGHEVCKAVKDVDASSYSKPTDVKVIMSNGNTYQVQLQNGAM